MATSATAPLGSTARTNQLLQEASKQTGIKAPTFNIDTPSQVSANVSKALNPQNPGGNPLDAPGAIPQAQPGKNLDGTQKGAPNPTNPSPQNPTPPQTTEGGQTNGQNTTGTPTTSSTGDTSGTPSFSQFQDQLKAKYGAAFDSLNKSGVTPPSSQGSAQAGVNTALDAQPKSQPKPETPPAVQALFGGDNENIQSQVQALQDIISPPAQKQALKDALDQLKTDKSSLQGLRLEQMNIKNIMRGTQQDIMDEVTKAGGTITQSLLSNMTIARNKALVAQSTQLDEQIQLAQDTVNTDTTLVSDEKQLAAQEATQRMGLLTFMQTNYNNQMNAARQSIDTLIKTPGGLAAYATDPVQAARAEQVMGYAPGTMNKLNAAQQAKTLLDMQKEQADIEQSKAATAASYASARKTNSEANLVTPGTTEYKAAETAKVNNQVETATTVLSKVNQANNLVGKLSSGLIGNVLQHVGGTDARNLKNNIDTIKANLAFSELQKMRDASKTGGALGQISDAEEVLLSSTVASLDIGQNAEQLKASLQEVKQHYTNWLAIQGYSVAPDGTIVKIQ